MSKPGVSSCHLLKRYIILLADFFTNSSAILNSLKSLIASIRNRGQHLIGQPDDLSLQTRIYHFVCITTIAVMFYVLIFSAIQQMVSYALITLLLIPLQIFLLYISRFRNRTALSMKVYILLIHGFFVISYRLSAGIAGSTLLSFSIVFFLSLAIVPRKEYVLLTLVNLGTVAGLLLSEYDSPAFVLTHYADRTEHFIDIASTYAVTIILMLSGLGYIIKNYTTEKENAEARASLLDELHEEKARLISIISHDYHTPLANLQHALYIMDTHELSPSELKIFTGEMRKSVVNTQSLLTNLLEITKTENGLYSFDMVTSFSVWEAMSETLDVYSDIARSNGQRIEVSIPEKLHINANQHLYTTVIRNLINNAVKYAGSGAYIRFSYQYQEGYHVFQVADNGPGIPEKVQQEILQSWNQSTRNVSRSGAIGLPLSKQYAAALGGDLLFETGPGGTIFFLKIPAVAPA
jgi:two-component system sensor histidine kinase/response regulator